MYEFDWSSIPGALSILATGMTITLQVTATAIAIGIVWGTLLAVARISGRPWLAWPAAIYVNAFRNMVPLLLTQAIILFQDTSLVYVIGLADFFGAAYKVGDRDGRLVELLLFAGLIYFVVSYGVSRLVQSLQRRTAPGSPTRTSRSGTAGSRRWPGAPP